MITWGACGHPLRPSKSHRAGCFCLVCDCLFVDNQTTMRMYRTEETDSYEGTWGEHARMRAEWKGREVEANACAPDVTRSKTPFPIGPADPTGEMITLGIGHSWREVEGTVERICPRWAGPRVIRYGPPRGYYNSKTNDRVGALDDEGNPGTFWGRGGLD